LFVKEFLWLADDRIVVEMEPVMGAKIRSAKVQGPVGSEGD
jgi:hypothetical protein